MKVFISWSGDRSNELAKALQEFLRKTLPGLQVWISEDISAGARWNDAVNKELEESNLGVLCLTAENLDAPWILFEAGAIAKRFSGSKLVPYCLGLSPQDIPLPLGQFMGVDTGKEGTKKLALTLNSMLESESKQQDKDRLLKSVDEHWPYLDDKIKTIRASGNPDKSYTERMRLTSQRDTLHTFLSRFVGHWWEYVPKHGLGFFEIQLDKVHSTVAMVNGRFYDTAGAYKARWASTTATVVDGNQPKIVYVRECWNNSRANSWFHGFGEMMFERPPGGPFKLGDGGFYDITEDNIGKTVKLPGQLHRVENADELSAITGNEHAMQAAVSNWLRDRKNP